MRVYRLCKSRYSNSVLSGDGGLHADGRWHSQGQPIVYCASSESLAVLELRVHVGPYLPQEGYTLHAIDVPDTLIESLSPTTLIAGWNAVPHSQVSQPIGDTWLEQRRSAALRVPSILSATEFNVLINVRCEPQPSISIADARSYHFDGRLFAR